MAKCIKPTLYRIRHIYHHQRIKSSLFNKDLFSMLASMYFILNLLVTYDVVWPQDFLLIYHSMKPTSSFRRLCYTPSWSLRVTWRAFFCPGIFHNFIKYIESKHGWGHIVSLFAFSGHLHAGWENLMEAWFGFFSLYIENNL